MQQKTSPHGADRRLQAALERHKKGDLAWANREYRQVLAEHPNHPTALHYLGLIAQQTGHPGQAVELLQRSISLDPHDPRAYNHLGQVLIALNRTAEAIRCFESAVAVDPAHTDSLDSLANALKARGELERAIALYRRVVELDPQAVSSLYNLANALRDKQEYAEARRLLERVIGIEPDHFRAHHNLAVLLEEMGRFEEAVDRYRAVLRVQPGHSKALANLLCIRSFQADSVIVDAATGRLADDRTQDDDRIKLHQGLGKHFDRVERYDEAFRHFAGANAILKRRRAPFRVAAVADYFDRIIRTFTAEYFAGGERRGRPSQRPVFIVGMPRSGTTLTEQILGSHPDVFAAGELKQIPALVRQLQPRYPEVMPCLDRQAVMDMADRYLQALESLAGPAAARVTDKLPINFTHVGLIATLFPHARIIHCRRDPLDAGLSCFTELFNMATDYTTDLRSIGEYLLQYERLMAHWRKVLPQPMFELRYEELVGDQEAGSRALLAACDLPWHDACRDFHRADRAVLTPSRWQVRQPIYASSVGRWKNYAAHLEPLREVLCSSARAI